MKLPIEEIEFQYSKSSGPGGQNVNKNNTKVSLRWDIENSNYYTATVLKRIKKQEENRISKDGILIIQIQTFSSQKANQEEALRILEEIIRKAKKPIKKRKKTRPPKSANKKRLDQKSKKSEKKSLRQKVKY